MREKRCRLTLAEKAWMGSGDAPDIPQRSWEQEWGGIKQGIKGQTQQYNKFWKQDPLLSQLYPGAAEYFGSETSPILQELQTQGLEQLKGGPSDLLQALTGQVSNQDYLSGKVSAQELSNVVDQPTLAKFASMGNVGGNQAALQNFLNRDQYVNERQQQHLGMAANIEQLGESDATRRFGIAGGVQGLTNQDIAQRFQIPQDVVGTSTRAYAGLTNPIYAYLSDLYSSNQNAAAAESIAGANASAGKTSGTLGAVGSIIGGVAAAY